MYRLFVDNSPIERIMPQSNVHMFTMLPLERRYRPGKIIDNPFELISR